MNINQNYLEEIERILWSKDEVNQFVEHCLMPLKKSIKINLHKIKVKEFVDLTEKWWWKITNPDFVEDENIFNDSYYIDRENIEFALWRSFLHMSWFFYIQEIAASMPSRFLDIKAWDIVLDISAAPWWKSAQIWDYLLQYNEKPWFVVSNDINPKRIQSLAHNLNRMWIYNSWITKLNWFMFWKNLWEIFDHVLVDAPCSWEWTWFKSDFALKNWKLQEINKICWTQFQLLVSAIKATKKWWTIIYSTCTLNPYENEENVAKVLEFFKWAIELEDVEILGKSSWVNENYDWEKIWDEEKEKVARFWPHKQKTWWFFIAKFRKTQSLEWKFTKNENKLAPRNPYKIDISKWMQKQVANYLLENFWINVDKSKFMFFATVNQVYITSPQFMELKDIIQFEKVWIPILKFWWDKKYLPLHWLWNVLWSQATKNFIILEEEDMQKYSQLQDISTEWLNWKFKDREFVIIKYNNWWMWVGKIIDWKIKNKYIKI